MKQDFISIICIFYGYIVLVGNIFMNKLDKKTRCKGDNIISGKWRWIFFIFNFWCYLFIDKIKEKRKIEFMERRIIMYDRMIKDWTFDTELLTLTEKEDLRNMKLYLKIKKIKKRNGTKYFNRIVNNY